MIALRADAWLSGIMKRPAYRADITSDGENKLPSPKGFYYSRVSTGDLVAVETLGALGFQVVDTGLTLERDLDGVGEVDARVRTTVSGDRAAVMDLARQSFRYSRFHLDRKIPKRVADDIKARWTGNFVNGERGDHMLVADAGDGVCGFLQLIHAADGALVIDLIAVAEAARGRGLGSAMLHAAQKLARGRRMRVGTQAANIASLQFYENFGFRMTASAYAMHLHA